MQYLLKLTDTRKTATSSKVPRSTRAAIGVSILAMLLLAASIGRANACAVVDSSEHYYAVVAMGSATIDTLGPFPVPIVILEPVDTNRLLLRIRFHHLGVLGDGTDTIVTPAGIAPNGYRTYKANHPLLQLQFPEVIYTLSIDVFDRKTGRMLESRLRPFPMKLTRYKGAHLVINHPPETGLGNEFVRRRFIPKLLPLTLETNPGWRAIESIDSMGVYAIQFVDPADSNSLFLSVTVTPTDELDEFDASGWKAFKEHAREAFGARDVRINSLSDFDVDDIASRKEVQKGYEFLAKDPLKDISYVATYRTPRAVILILAPLGNQVGAERLAYLRAIAKSFAIKR